MFMGDPSDLRPVELREECSRKQEGPKAGRSLKSLKLRNEEGLEGQTWRRFSRPWLSLRESQILELDGLGSEALLLASWAVVGTSLSLSFSNCEVGGTRFLPRREVVRIK